MKFILLINDKMPTIIVNMISTKISCKDPYGSCIGQDKEFFEHKIIIIFLPINLNMCFGCSKEPSHRDVLSEYPQYMFLLRNKKNNFPLRFFTWRPCYGYPFLQYVLCMSSLNMSCIYSEWVVMCFLWIHCTDILIKCKLISLCFLIYTQKVIHYFPAHIFPAQMLPGYPS